jgi:hypothetical protein
VLGYQEGYRNKRTVRAARRQYRADTKARRNRILLLYVAIKLAYTFRLSRSNSLTTACYSSRGSKLRREAIKLILFRLVLDAS